MVISDIMTASKSFARILIYVWLPWDPVRRKKLYKIDSNLDISFIQFDSTAMKTDMISYTLKVMQFIARYYKSRYV